MHKRGLSEVITSVIMVLLVLVAIAIVWVVVKNVLSGTDDISISRITIRLEIKNVVVDNSTNNISVTLKRETGKGDVSGIKFVVTDGINSQSFMDNSQLRELEEKKFTFTVNNQTIFVDNVTQVSVVPILTTQSGKALSGMTYNYDVKEGTTTTSSQQDGTPPSCINDDYDHDGYNVTSGCGPIDCNDTNLLINPGATEICGNNIDENCDEQINLGNFYYRDKDNDGFGNLTNVTQSCSQPVGYVTNNTDCDDEMYGENCGTMPYSFFVVHNSPTNTNYGPLDPPEFVPLQDLVNTADKYNVKLTLQFNPQWIDMFNANQTMKNIVKSWQANGHEISIEHHGPSHMSWNGYSNMPAAQAINISYIRATNESVIHNYFGSVDEINEYYSKFSEFAGHEVKSATITNKWTDVPQNIIYLTEGGTDGRNKKAIKNIWNDHLTYRLNIQGLWSNRLLTDAKNNYELLTKNEIMGIIAHGANFVGDGKLAIEEWFKYLNSTDSSGIKRKTVTWLMENYVLPNNLLIDGFCGDYLCDDSERYGVWCEADCGDCIFPEDCVWCTEREECRECNTMRDCEQGTNLNLLDI